MDLHPPTQRSTPVVRVGRDSPAGETDLLAAEEPLGILLTWPGRDEPYEFVVTMRTPGDDAALAIGYLRSERLLTETVRVREVISVPGAESEVTQVLVALSAAPPGLDLLRRTGYASSSCGLCGTATVEAIEKSGLEPLVDVENAWPSHLITRLPALMRREQNVFERTGGLHAAALFAASGDLRVLAEDIGRHNAVDKVIGQLWIDGEHLAPDDILAVSGRAGFEIVQKARVVGIAGMAAVGAPSSLAVELARRSGMTLIGFVRGERFNIYSGSQRVEVTHEVADLGK